MEVIRKGKIQTFEINRDIIPVNSIEASYMIDKKSGYIKIDKFSTQTYREFMTALMELKKQGLERLILDLRGNGGGVLDEAIEIADEFLDGDKLITYTEGKHSPKKEYRCRRLGQFENGSLAVLCDEESASASEVLMGALQDWDRATIIGRRSFGKGLVQEQYDLSDNSALRITIARYFTPLGRSIQRSYANGQNEYYNEVINRSNKDEIKNEDSLKLSKSKKYITPKGKVLLDGGGIYPDYFIANDTLLMGDKIVQLFSKNIINKFVFQLIISNSNTSKNFQDFLSKYQISESEWNNLMNLANESKIDIVSLNKNEKEFLENIIKSRMARVIWNKNEMYEILNNKDSSYKKAYELILK